MELNCKKCEANLPIEAAFCLHCGTACREEENQAPQNAINICSICGAAMKLSNTGKPSCFDCRKKSEYER